MSNFRRHPLPTFEIELTHDEPPCPIRNTKNLQSEFGNTRRPARRRLPIINAENRFIATEGDIKKCKIEPDSFTRLTPVLAGDHTPGWDEAGLVIDDPYDHGLSPTRRKLKRATPRLTQEQQDVLEAHFQMEHNPSTSTRRRFAKDFDVPLYCINTWFHNQRFTVKSAHSDSVSDPFQRPVKTMAPPPLPTEMPQRSWSFLRDRLLDGQRNLDTCHSVTTECPSLSSNSTVSSRTTSIRTIDSARSDGSSFGDAYIGEVGPPEHYNIYKDEYGFLHTNTLSLPEKCPIETCKYHIRGFAKVINKVRHTCTHFQGSMICGFCPQNEDRSYSQADIFRRHLQANHHAQSPSARNLDNRGPDADVEKQLLIESRPIATCTLCSEPFDPHGMFEHLFGCVYRQVTRDDSEEHEHSDSTKQDQDKVSECLSNNNVTGKPGIAESFLCKTSQDPTIESKRDVSGQCAAQTSNEPSLADHGDVPPVEEHTPPPSGFPDITELEASSRCLSLTSSKGTVSSGEETDWTDATRAPSPDSLPDVSQMSPVLSLVKRQIVDDLMSNFHQAFDHLLSTRVILDGQAGLRTCNGGEGSASGSGESSQSSTTSSRENINSSFVSRKRSLSDGRPDNDGGDDPNKRQKPDAGEPSDACRGQEQRFACPFYKRNPQRHLTFTSCRDPGFVTVARLKEHLYRRHLLPIQCNRCCSTFTTEPLLVEHQRDPRICEIRERAPLEGFNKDQERKLKSKRRALVAQTEEDKWKKVYCILFPDDPAEAMPSPYIEYTTRNDDETQADTSNVARFQEFSRLELPRLVRRTLEMVVEEEAQPLENKLKERLVDIVKECQTQLFSMFETSHDVSGIAPLELEKNAGESQELIAAHPDTSFSDFDSQLAPTYDLPFILKDNEPLIPQENVKPHATAPERRTSGTPDSGYDSTWTNIVPQMPPSSSFGEESGYTTPNLGGYYGLFEDKTLTYADFGPEMWSFVNPTTADGGAWYGLPGQE